MLIGCIRPRGTAIIALGGTGVIAVMRTACRDSGSSIEMDSKCSWHGSLCVSRMASHAGWWRRACLRAPSGCA